MLDSGSDVWKEQLNGVELANWQARHGLFVSGFRGNFLGGAALPLLLPAKLAKRTPIHKTNILYSILSTLTSIFNSCDGEEKPSSIDGRHRCDMAGVIVKDRRFHASLKPDSG